MNRPLIRIPAALAAALFAAALALGAGAARADGLSDLKSALARLPAQSPFKATLDVRTLESHGEGKDLDEKTGQADLWLEDGPRGLRLVLPRETLARLDAESRAQGRDPKTKTPTMLALAKFESADAPPMVAAGSQIERVLDEGQFRGERVDTWQGRPARLLSFALPATRLTDVQRKYVKKFDGSFDLWIAADGTPLGSATRESGAGRAFVVISFEAHQDEDCSYGVVGDRLVALRREQHNYSSGAGERGEIRIVKTLQPQS